MSSNYLEFYLSLGLLRFFKYLVLVQRSSNHPPMPVRILNHKEITTYEFHKISNRYWNDQISRKKPFTASRSLVSPSLSLSGTNRNLGRNRRKSPMGGSQSRDRRRKKRRRAPSIEVSDKRGWRDKSRLPTSSGRHCEPRSHRRQEHQSANQWRCTTGWHVRLIWRIFWYQNWSLVTVKTMHTQ